MGKRDTSDEPYIDNYPPLKEWLEKHEAKCNWQLRLGGDEDRPTGFVESWFLNGGGEVIIVVYRDGNGWNIYTPCQSSRIDATLADADARLHPQETKVAR